MGIDKVAIALDKNFADKMAGIDETGHVPEKPELTELQKAEYAQINAEHNHS